MTLAYQAFTRPDLRVVFIIFNSACIYTLTDMF